MTAISFEDEIAGHNNNNYNNANKCNYTSKVFMSVKMYPIISVFTITQKVAVLKLSKVKGKPDI